MGGLFQRIGRRFPPGFFPWAGLALLLASGTLTAIADLAALPGRQTQLANRTAQRVVIDPRSGAVSGLRRSDVPAAAFDVEAPPSSSMVAEDVPSPAPLAEEEIAMPASASAAEKTAEAPPAVADDAGAESPGSAAGTGGDAMPALQAPAAPLAIPTIARGGDSLVPAPAPEITENLRGLAIPKRGAHDAMAAALYARSFTNAAQKPTIAIVVTDVGFSPQSLQRIIALPKNIAVAISPYAIDTARQVAALRNSGHEVWAMLPVMGARYPQDDPGPLGLIANLEWGELRKRLHRALAVTLGSVGVVLPADETLSSHPEAWEPLVEELRARGLFILSTHPTHSVKALSAHASVQAIIRRADMLLDSTPDPAFIRSKLAAVAQAALAGKKQVALISARPQSLAILEAWLKEDPLGKGAVLAPLSAVYAPDTPPPAPAAEKKEKPHGGGH